jgi:hypothetical protein
MRSSVHRITSAAGLAVALALVCPQPLVAQEADDGNVVYAPSFPTWSTAWSGRRAAVASPR